MGQTPHTEMQNAACGVAAVPAARATRGLLCRRFTPPCAENQSVS